MPLSDTLNPWQKTAANSYGGGDFAHIAAYEGLLLQQAVKECGDTLFKFIMIELDTSEDCLDEDEAFRRISMAKGNLDEVLEALDV
jgi:hypothetical protein